MTLAGSVLEPSLHQPVPPGEGLHRALCAAMSGRARMPGGWPVGAVHQKACAAARHMQGAPAPRAQHHAVIGVSLPDPGHVTGADLRGEAASAERPRARLPERVPDGRTTGG